MSRIAVDLDGVCYPFYEVFNQWCIKAGYIEEVVEKKMSWFHAYGIDDERFDVICGEAVDAGFLFLEGNPLPNSVQTLQRLRSDGHTLHYCTARRYGHRSEANTMEWLHFWNFPIDSVTFAQDKTIIRPDIFLDDFVCHVDAMSELGVEAYLMYDPPREDQLGHPFFVSDWDAFYNKVSRTPLAGWLGGLAA